MRTFGLEKLVRDEVFASMLALGQQIEYRVLADGWDFWRALLGKLGEEVRELRAPGAQVSKELADITQVLGQMSIELQAGFSSPETGRAPHQAGVFAGRVYVESVTLADNDPWVEYYAANPEVFPEITQPKGDETCPDLLE